MRSSVFIPICMALTITPLAIFQGADDVAQAATERAKRPQTVSYGTDKRQVVNFYGVPSTAAKPPLVLYVHGGGWRNGDEDMVAQKPAFFAQNGFAFGSIGYRLLPDAPVETQAQDVADAVRKMRKGRHHWAMMATASSSSGTAQARIWWR